MLTTKVGAQRTLYICQGEHCDAFGANAYNRLKFLDGDNLQVGMRPAYAIADIDSMVFHTPQLDIRERGWWGNTADGLLCYKDSLKFLEAPFYFNVLFSISVENGMCTAATCELRFDEPWMVEMFIPLDPTIGSESNSDAYIYVKLTQTGPRKHDVWTMTNAWSVWPWGCDYTVEDTTIKADCSLLAGRPIDEVVEIVEAWIYLEGEKQEFNPFDDD